MSLPWRVNPHTNTARLGLTIPREPTRSSDTRVQLVMPAKYPATCLDCGAPLAPGTSILWTRGQGARCAGGHQSRRPLPGAEEPGPEGMLHQG